MLIHPFEPVYNSNSKILILGTFPSVKSREESFYYAHPQNRFWKVLSSLTKHSLPKTVEEKMTLLLSKGIALWDILQSCEIDASKDSSIKNPVVNDLSIILSSSNIKAIFTNGKKAEQIYRTLSYPNALIESHVLPSTSSANAYYTFEKLIKAWDKILDFLE